MFSRPSDIKYSFVSSSFVLFRIIQTAEVCLEPSRTFFQGFQRLPIFIKSSMLHFRLGFEHNSE